MQGNVGQSDRTERKTDRKINCVRYDCSVMHSKSICIFVIEV